MSVLPGSTSGIIVSAVAPATPAYALPATLLIDPATALNCDMFTASVGLTPGATFVRRRSLPGEPTDTVFAWSATEFAPNATELGADAVAFAPSATPLLADTSAFAPITVAPSADAFAALPSAMLLEPLAVALGPSAIAFTPVAPLSL